MIIFFIEPLNSMLLPFKSTYRNVKMFFMSYCKMFLSFLVNKNMFKVNSRNDRTRCEQIETLKQDCVHFIQISLQCQIFVVSILEIIKKPFLRNGNLAGQSILIKLNAVYNQRFISTSSNESTSSEQLQHSTELLLLFVFFCPSKRKSQ